MYINKPLNGKHTSWNRRTHTISLSDHLGKEVNIITTPHYIIKIIDYSIFSPSEKLWGKLHSSYFNSKVRFKVLNAVFIKSVLNLESVNHANPKDETGIQVEKRELHEKKHIEITYKNSGKHYIAKKNAI